MAGERHMNVSWTEAENKCQSLGGHLMSINSHEELRTVYVDKVLPLVNLMSVLLEQRLFNVDNFFIGLIDGKVSFNA